MPHEIKVIIWRTGRIYYWPRHGGAAYVIKNIAPNMTCFVESSQDYYGLLFCFIEIAS